MRLTGIKIAFCVTLCKIQLAQIDETFNGPHFLWVYRWDGGRLEKYISNERKASDLQSPLSVFPTPQVCYYAGKPI